LLSLWSRWEIYLLWQVQGDILEQIVGWLINTWWSSNISLLYKNHTWKFEVELYLYVSFFPCWVDYLEAIVRVSYNGPFWLWITFLVYLMKIIVLNSISFTKKLLFFHSLQFRILFDYLQCQMIELSNFNQTTCK
jgi:hypothetical protein